MCVCGSNRFEDAFNQVLHTGDVGLVDWLCGRLDPEDLCSREPVPLTQGVLLSLLSQLSTSLPQVPACVTPSVCPCGLGVGAGLCS